MFKVGDIITPKPERQAYVCRDKQEFKDRFFEKKFVVTELLSDLSFIKKPLDYEGNADEANFINWKLYKDITELFGVKCKKVGNCYLFENGEKLYLTSKNKLYDWSEYV